MIDRGGMEAVRAAQEGGGMCIHIADSHCCIAEINTTLQSNYLPINFFDLKKNNQLQTETYNKVLFSAC